MAVTIIINLVLKPEYARAYLKHLTAVLPDTRASDGCMELNSYLKQGQPEHLVIIEVWESQEKQKAYMEWRKSIGAFDKMGDVLSEPMQITYLEKLA